MALTEKHLDTLRRLASAPKDLNVTIARSELRQLVAEIDRLRGLSTTAVPDDFVEPRVVALRDGFWKGER